eukprot:Skav214040  [mRNA]  locus=scaffold2017:58802:61152:+ [translate_table: standard]
MALWEVEHYTTALRGRLQYSSPYWGAAVMGQMDLALAFGACNVICQAQQPEDIAQTCASFEVTVLGIVPSQLRSWKGPHAKPRSLRLLITWAERTPPKLAREWCRDPRTQRGERPFGWLRCSLGGGTWRKEVVSRNNPGT